MPKIYPNITKEEILIKRNKLQVEINKLIENFIEETGCMVEGQLTSQKHHHPFEFGTIISRFFINIKL